jgi:Xaa-Pro aminopeptidase
VTAPAAAVEFEERRRALASEFEKRKIDAMFIAFLPNVRYLTGFTGSNGAVLLKKCGAAIFFTDPRYRLASASEVGCPVKVCAGPTLPEVARAIRAARIRRLGFEKSRLGYESFEFLREGLGAACRLVPVAGAVEARRVIKSPAEIELIRRAVRTNSAAFEAALRAIRPGRTREADLAAEIDYRMRRLGAERPAFDTIVAVAERTALPHAQPSDRILEPNALLLIDMGATQAGYASDMTRVVSLGNPSSRIRKLYRAVLEAQLAAIDAVRPGAPAGLVDRKAREVLKAKGLDKAFVHSTGHGLGLEIHEPPRLGKREKARLEPGMAITIEPGAYLEGFGGVRIEDTVVVTATGCEILTDTSKELRVI